MEFQGVWQRWKTRLYLMATIAGGTPRNKKRTGAFLVFLFFSWGRGVGVVIKVKSLGGQIIQMC